MHKNLSEERSRMQKLMGFIYEYNSHDILSEQVIKKSVISEQPNTVSGAVKREPLKPVSFSDAFKDNMVGVDPESSHLTGALHLLDKQVQSKNKEGKRLESISVEVDAGATPLSATNGLPEGVSTPDHDYGLGYTKVCDVGKKDKCWLPYKRRTERVSIPNGNTYLANQRANNLKVYLEEYLTEKYEAKVIVTIKIIETDSEKYASAVITGVVLKRPGGQPTNFYISAPGKRIGDKFYMGAAPASIWGKKKLNINNDFTLEKAQELAKKNITDRTDRDVRVEKDPGREGNPSDWYGTNQAWVEVKDYEVQTANEQQKGVIDYWFENSESWEDEKKNLQKHRRNAATLGGVGIPGREGSTGHYSFTGTKAKAPEYEKKTTTEPLMGK